LFITYPSNNKAQITSYHNGNLRFVWEGLFCQNASRKIPETREADLVRRRNETRAARTAAKKRKAESLAEETPLNST